MRRKLKVGMSVWEVVYDETGCELHKWVIRTIRNYRGKMTAYFICKNSCTWVKKSRKNYDWGWADDIDDLWRKSISIKSYERNGLPHDFAFKKSDAYKLAAKTCKEEIKTLYPHEVDFIEGYTNTLKTLKRMYNRYKNKGE